MYACVLAVAPCERVYSSRSNATHIKRVLAIESTRATDADADADAVVLTPSRRSIPSVASTNAVSAAVNASMISTPTESKSKSNQINPHRTRRDALFIPR